MTDLLLIHGWGFDSRVWAPLLERLAGHCRIRLGDLPGYGQDLDPATLPPGTVVCGWSQGAQAAMQLALAHPERVARLILIGASPRFVAAPGWPDAQPATLLETFAAGVQDRTAATLKRFATLVNHGDADARTTTRRLQALIEERCPAADVLVAGLAALRDVDLRARAADIGQPTLLLHGDQDALMPPAAARWLAERLPIAHLEELPGRGHAPFLTATASCTSHILDFLHG